MPNINILSPLVADMIAAGEVVERPGSVIKELMENAIDAGAKNITVELRGGGAAYIRVTDDGCGMSPEDAGVAFLRHATSKLSDARGLEAIGTLGFRGEALAAISAVSRIEMTTREKGAETGCLVALEAGDIQEMRPAGCPEGTTMIVRDLFYNTPARFKFLKSDRAEAQNCVNLALRCALGHPEVSVKCIRDGQDVFFSPGDGRVDSCIYSLLGRDVAQGFLKAESEADGITVRGYVSSPRAGRGNRGLQHFFCNGRAIRSATLQAALEQAYKNTLMVGRFPACVLYIDLSFAAVDVNVHPTKSEVKFSDERKAFDAVYHAALGALEQENALPARPTGVSAPKMVSPSAAPRAAAPAAQLRMPLIPAAPKAEMPAPRDDFYRKMTAETFRETLRAPAPRQEKPKEAPLKSVLPVASPTREYARSAEAGLQIQKAIPQSAPIEPEAETEEIPAFRLVGEAFGCYILVEVGEEMLLIDKHAAHERVIFDRMKAEKRAVMSQSLLLPVTFTPGEADTELLLENAAALEKLGFEIEAFGRDSIVLRALPADTDAADALPMLEELCEKLRRGGESELGGVQDELLHTVACKAAIKAGRSSTPKELEALAEKVLRGEVKYCPHGRPVSVTMTKKELDKRFGRLG